MAKLFNNIRKKLISDTSTGNRTRTYLKYAFGEIVLVVIGILIALAINNWNAQLKHNKSRINYTKSLILDLKRDSLQLVDENLRLSGRLDNLQKIKHRLSSPLATIDTLNYIIKYEHNPSFVDNAPINRNTFSILTSTGNLDFLMQRPQKPFKITIKLPRTTKNSIPVNSIFIKIYLFSI